MNGQPPPRIPPLPVEERDADVRALLGRVAVATGDANIFTTFVRARHLFRRWLAFSGVLLDGTLPARDRELLILRTGWNCGAEYEWAQHAIVGRQVGLTEEEIDRVAGGPIEKWDPPDQALLAAADELHRDCCIADDTWSELTRHYRTEQLIEIPMLVGHYHLVAMTLLTLGVQLDEDLTGFPSDVTA